MANKGIIRTGMKVDKLTIVTDVVTDERQEFKTQTLATAYLREITGRKTQNSTLATVKNTGRLIYNRYLIEGKKGRTEKTYTAKKKVNHHLIKDGWEYDEFSFADSVIVAVKKGYKATEEKLNDTIYGWRSKILRIYIDRLDEKRERERNIWSVEIYLKLDKDTPFLRKVDLMEKTIKTLGL